MNVVINSYFWHNDLLILNGVNGKFMSKESPFPLQNEIKGKVYEEMLMVKMNNMPFNSTDYQ
jgi:hypothetical protein